MNASPSPAHPGATRTIEATEADPVPDQPNGQTRANSQPRYSATGLPSGLSISTDGVISGAVTSLGTHTVTLTATENARIPRRFTFDWIVL
jgi:hypothetical protein